jgi:hypothetical protein
MPNITIAVGALLIAYGGYSFGIAEVKSPTALIPAFFGAGFVLLGLVALKEKFLKHAMHAAAMLGLLGFIGGGIMGFPKLPKLIAGEIADAKDLNKARSQNMLAFICLIFLLMCVNSFIQTRQRRKQQEKDSAQGPK